MGTDTNHQQLRANIILYFAVSSVLTILTYLYGGLLSFEMFQLSAIAGPAYGLGILGGSKAFPFASANFFRTSSLMLSLPIFR
jgi:uncharacterized protein